MRNIAYVLRAYPRVTETFIAQDILRLQANGIGRLIVSFHGPIDDIVNEVNQRIILPVLQIPEYPSRELGRALIAISGAIVQTRFLALLPIFLRDLRRDFCIRRLRRFVQACILARELPADIGWLHAHYLQAPSSVARYCAILKGLPWSFSAHAKDVWTTPEWEMEEKIADCRWGLVCTEVGARRLRSYTSEPAKIELLYHGIDGSKFPTQTRSIEGNGVDRPIRLLSVARAVEKKGLDVLIEALSLIPSTLRWELTQIGAGPDLQKLQAQAEELRIADRIRWLGSLDQSVVTSHYSRSDLFVLPSRIAKDGDRDGLPNVLMEALATGLPCISTSVAGIPELITHGLTGLLVPPEDPIALSHAISTLIGDAKLRHLLGGRGERHVRDRFDAKKLGGRMVARFANRADHAPTP